MSNLKLHITFASTPRSAKAIVAPQKFNKRSAIMQTWDDGNYEGWSNGMAIWAANNVGCTDGCGNFRPMVGDVAVNIDKVTSGYASAIRQIIKSGGDIVNHSTQHTNKGTLGGVNQQLKVIDDSMLNTYHYKMNNFVVPNNDAGFGRACLDAGYLSINSEGDVFDVLNPKRFHRIFKSDINPTWALIRDFADEWQDVRAGGQMDYLKSNIQMLLNGQRNFYIIGTHDSISSRQKAAGFAGVYKYLMSVSRGHILTCTVREWLEYHLMKRQAVIKQRLDGKVLTISVDTTKLSDRVRWQDISFNVSSDKLITGVRADGFSSSSFNSTTGLVNGFKQTTDFRIPAQRNRRLGIFRVV